MPGSGTIVSLFASPWTVLSNSGAAQLFCHTYLVNRRFGMLCARSGHVPYCPERIRRNEARGCRVPPDGLYHQHPFQDGLQPTYLFNDVLTPLYPPSRSRRKVICKLQGHNTKRPDVYSDRMSGRFTAGLHLGGHVKISTAVGLQAAALGEAKVC
jgi:hypothetical protein